MSDSLWKITWPTCSSTESSTSTIGRITSPGNGEAETMPRRVNLRWPKGTQKALNYEITWHLYLKLVTLEPHLQVVAYLGEPGSAQALRSFCYVSQPRPQPPCFASVSCNEDRLCFQIWRMKGSSNTFLPFPSFPQSLHQLQYLKFNCELPRHRSATHFLVMPSLFILRLLPRRFMNLASNVLELTFPFHLHV